MATSSTSYSPDIRRDAPRKRLKPADVLVRAATAELCRVRSRPGLNESIEAVIARRYDGCPATQFYARAAVSPAASTTATWAAELVGTAMIDFMASDMARQSGFAQLAQRALTVTLDGFGSVKVPARASPLTLMGAWIGESNAKPVFAGVLNSTTLLPYKLAAISTFTEEMVASTMIEAIVREVLAHDLSALLDSALFDAAAVSAGVRPAGLWNGATAVTASALTPANEAMLADLKALAAAVNGSGNPDARVVFVCNPAQAVRINLLAPAYDNLIVSGYQAAGSVGAIDAGGVAMIVAQPVFQGTRDAALHMETAPTALSAVGSPNTVAAPIRSLFQEDLLGLRCVLRAGWVKRRPAATALASAVTW